MNEKIDDYIKEKEMMKKSCKKMSEENGILVCYEDNIKQKKMSEEKGCDDEVGGK